MPAEAIHLTAWADLCGNASTRLRRMIEGPRRGAAARIGVMFVDLPYFHRFHWGVLRYWLGLPQAVSPWGDRLHQQAPIALGVQLAEAGARLQRRRATRDAGQELLALALGYWSHAAIDTALHPLVNRLAVERGARLGTPEFSRAHQEVEKFQSVLFHEVRHGVDHLGTQALRGYITIDWRLLEQAGPVSAALDEALRATLGAAPSRDVLATWTRGYRLFVSLISGPLGRRAVSAQDKQRERHLLFEDCEYVRRFDEAVARSARWIDALLDHVDDGTFDASSRRALACVVPEQSLDPAPEPSPCRSTRSVSNNQRAGSTTGVSEITGLDHGTQLAPLPGHAPRSHRT